MRFFPIGVGLVIATAAFSNHAVLAKPGDSQSKPKAKQDDHEHVHEHKAPRGGTLVVLGEESAHMELIGDRNAGTLTAYILDGEAENPIRLKIKNLSLNVRYKDNGNQETTGTITFTAQENPLTGETVGDTSEFKAQAPFLKKVSTFKARIPSIKIRGSQFTNVDFSFPEGNH